MNTPDSKASDTRESLGIHDTAFALGMILFSLTASTICLAFISNHREIQNPSGWHILATVLLVGLSYIATIAAALFGGACASSNGNLNRTAQALIAASFFLNILGSLTCTVSAGLLIFWRIL
jgi:hypothetical protein